MSSGGGCVSFVLAAAGIGELRDPALLRRWLYAMCRKSALRRRGRDGVTRMVPPVADRGGYGVVELRRLVWDAAGGLAPRDRWVLAPAARDGGA